MIAAVRGARRRAFTLVEMVVAVALGLLALVVVYNAILLLVKGEKSTDRAALRAITEARLMETLLQDVRSAARVEGQPPAWTIVRYVVEPGGGLAERSVRWKMEGARVERAMDGSRPETFDFTGLAAAGADPTAGVGLVLRLERVADDDESTFDPR